MSRMQAPMKRPTGRRTHRKQWTHRTQWTRRVVFVLALLGGVLAGAAAPGPPPLPNFGGWQKTASTTVLQSGWGLPQPEAAVMNELGLSSIERATYHLGDRTIQVQGYRFGDPGGAYGAFTYYRPDNFHAIDLGQPHDVSAAGGTAMLFTRGDWLIRLQRDQWTGTAATMRQLAANLTATAGVDELPDLPYYLPRKDLAPGSLHYVRGPAGFAAACAWVPPLALGFDKSAEAMIARYDFGTNSNGSRASAQLVLISYPTPQLARTYLAQLQQLPGFQVRRTGPMLVLVHANGAAGDHAALLLRAINWDAQFTIVPPTPPGLGELPALVLGIFVLCGLIMGVAVAVGLLSGLLWVWADKLLPRRFQHPEREALICLHLSARVGDKFHADPRSAS